MKRITTILTLLVSVTFYSKGQDWSMALLDPRNAELYMPVFIGSEPANTYNVFNRFQGANNGGYFNTTAATIALRDHRCSTPGIRLIRDVAYGENSEYLVEGTWQTKIRAGRQMHMKVAISGGYAAGDVPNSQLYRRADLLDDPIDVSDYTSPFSYSYFSHSLGALIVREKLYAAISVSNPFEQVLHKYGTNEFSTTWSYSGLIGYKVRLTNSSDSSKYIPKPILKPYALVRLSGANMDQQFVWRDEGTDGLDPNVVTGIGANVEYKTLIGGIAYAYDSRGSNIVQGSLGWRGLRVAIRYSGQYLYPSGVSGSGHFSHQLTLTYMRPSAALSRCKYIATPHL